MFGYAQLTGRDSESEVGWSGKGQIPIFNV